VDALALIRTVKRSVPMEGETSRNSASVDDLANDAFRAKTIDRAAQPVDEVKVPIRGEGRSFGRIKASRDGLEA
jgi:hypothetical protein